MSFITHAAEMSCCVRLELRDGREYLVAPVVALAEGVLNGALVPAAEIGKFVEAWNDIPVPVGHPRERGVPISARRLEVLDREVIGRFYNARFDGARLAGEIWLDVAKASALGGDALRALQRLERSEPLEVSTGYFCDSEATAGAFGGRPYSEIQRHLRPDHLALLLDQQGACSWADGCGVPRINEQGAGGEPSGAMIAFFLPTDVAQALMLDPAGLPDGAQVTPAGDLHVTLAYLGETAELELAEADVALRLADAARRLPLIYAQISGAGRFNHDEGGSNALYASLDSPSLQFWRDALLDMTGLGWVLNREHGFTPHVTLAYLPAQAPMPNVLPSAWPIVFDKVTLAWGSHRTGFTLQGEALPVTTLNAGGNDVSDTVIPVAVVETPPTPETNAQATPPEVAELLTAINELGGVAGLRQALADVQETAQAERATLVAELTANERNAFGADDLKALSTDQLRKLTASLRPADYRGRGAQQSNVADEWVVLVAPEVK